MVKGLEKGEGKRSVAEGGRDRGRAVQREKERDEGEEGENM